MAERKRTRAKEQSLARMFADLEEQERDFERFKLTSRLVPPGWYDMERKAPVTLPKRKLTLALDADMVAWFRGLGRGYQPRMNAVLRAYMHAVIAKEVERQGDRDWQGKKI